MLVLALAHRSGRPVGGGPEEGGAVDAKGDAMLEAKWRPAETVEAVLGDKVKAVH